VSDLVPYGSPAWLANMITTWLASPAAEKLAPDDPGDPVAEITITTAHGDKLGWAPLSPAAVRELGRALQTSVDETEQAQRRVGRADAIAAVLVDARRCGEDVGELLLAALNRAADRCGLGPIGLTMGRPGSWESTVVRDWAAAGWPIIPPNADRLAELVDVLAAMADARDDGGYVLSWALGMAADQIGGPEQLIAGSPFMRSRGAWNMIVQYARPGEGLAA
jgi:hypothetical protein